MRRMVLNVAAGSLAALTMLSAAGAADLVWEVENPFRLYKNSSAFELHERAFAAVHGRPDEPVPGDIVARMEKHLNTPDCRDPSTPMSCEATVRNAARFRASQRGWAARTLPSLCYDDDARPRRYQAACARTYGRRTVREDYILPDAHTVSIRLSAERAAPMPEGDCTWTWRPRSGNTPAASKTQPCKQKLVIDRVPYTANQATSGIAVDVTLPDGTKLSEPNVVVEDLLIVVLGDSFASGESNPDRPVIFGNRETVYEPFREEIATAEGGFATQSAPERPALMSPPPAQNPRALPRRLMADEERGEIFRRASPEFLKAFNDRAAAWFSADCHRSQYAYPVRVALQLALENRQRAVTLVHLACSGAQVTEGLFVPQDPREGAGKSNTMVPAQLDQLTDLLCRDAAPARTQRISYSLPFFKPGSAPETRNITKTWCASDRRKRAIDLVLLSVGGNDVGFGALAAYTVTESAGDIAPIVAWIGQQVRFGPDVARRYLDVLDERLKAVRDASCRPPMSRCNTTRPARSAARALRWAWTCIRT